METLIHCNHCQEDTNSADWEANRGVCPHCGRATGSQIELLRASRHNPLRQMRRRLEFAPLLQTRPATVLA